MAKAEGAPAFTMNQRAALLAGAEARTISGAAARLHVSASALSAAVTALERALRTRLRMRRKAKGASLTPTGEVVLPRARYLLHQASDLEADARGEARGGSGLVRVGCYPSLAPTVLPVLVSEVTTAHPDARVEIHENTRDELTRRLESGELDLAIMYDLDLDLDPTWQSARLAELPPWGRAPGAAPAGRQPGPDRPQPPQERPHGPARHRPERQPRRLLLRPRRLHPPRRLARSHVRDRTLLRRPRLRLDATAPASQRQC